MWSNFHTHSLYCDGKTGLKELLLEAESEEMLSLGFSSHAPLPFEKGWAMKTEHLDDYLSEIRSLKSKKTTVEVYAGLEIDYVPGKITPAEYKERLDYTIGSVHFVDEFDNGSSWEIDNTNAVFMEGLKGIFKGNVKQAISRYYELIREMLIKSTPDVAGHIDKIKIQNINDQLFKEDDFWYRKEVLKTIETIRETNVIVEINTRGIYQKKSATTYPSPWIVEQLFKNDVLVTISSDAHHPKDLTNCFGEAAKLLLTTGYKSIQILHEGNWKPYKFNESGLIV